MAKQEKPLSPNAQAAVALTDAALTPPRPAPEPTGIPTLDAALADPAAREAISTAAVAQVALGGIGGVVLGAAGGAAVIGLAWALWPKKKRTT